LALVVGALGVVFGDIGTSPIYTFQTIFNPDDPHPVPITTDNVYGVVSLIFWSVMIIVTLTYSIPSAILAESTLSFIGIGINDPYSAWGTSWGTLVQDGYRAMRSYPHVIAFPAAAIFSTILSLNILGNGLRDILDPKQR